MLFTFFFSSRYFQVYLLVYAAMNLFCTLQRILHNCPSWFWFQKNEWASPSLLYCFSYIDFVVLLIIETVYMIGEFVIDTPQKLKSKLEMVTVPRCSMVYISIILWKLSFCWRCILCSLFKVEALGEIELATKLLKEDIDQVRYLHSLHSVLYRLSQFLMLKFVQRKRNHAQVFNSIFYPSGWSSLFPLSTFALWALSSWSLLWWIFHGIYLVLYTKSYI